jgi:hypothetical protein
VTVEVTERVEADPTSADAVFLGIFSCLDRESRLASAVLAGWGAAA